MAGLPGIDPEVLADLRRREATERDRSRGQSDPYGWSPPATARAGRDGQRGTDDEQEEPVTTDQNRIDLSADLSLPLRRPEGSRGYNVSELAQRSRRLKELGIGAYASVQREPLVNRHMLVEADAYVARTTVLILAVGTLVAAVVGVVLYELATPGILVLGTMASGVAASRLAVYCVTRTGRHDGAGGRAHS